jgi:hypothetical protein
VTADQARTLVPILDSEFTRVSEALGCRSEERLTAIVQTPEAYRQSMGAAEWSGGQFDGRIRVALLEKTPGDLTRQTFRARDRSDKVWRRNARILPIRTTYAIGLAHRAGERLISLSCFDSCHAATRCAPSGCCIKGVTAMRLVISKRR